MTIDSKFINEFISSQDYLSQARLSRVRSGDQEFFQLTAAEWLGHQDIPTEKVTYASLAGGIIKEIEYDGANRYLEDNPTEESFKIALHLRNFESLAKLARLLEYSRFKQVGYLDTIRALAEDSLLTLHFSQERLQKNTSYLDHLFALISQIETLPLALLTDLKSVVAYNCVERFKRRLAVDGFAKAFKLLRHTALKGVFSPFYVAALYCRRLKQFKEARQLIKTIPQTHANYDIARTLERSIYEQEISLLNAEIHRLKPNAILLKEPLKTKQTTLKQTETPSIAYSDLPKNNIEILTSKSLPLHTHSPSFSKTIAFSPSLKRVLTKVNESFPETVHHRESQKLNK